MLISTKGRYALRVMIDLAEHNDGNYIRLKEIAERQEISKKYMESIMGVLSKSGLVDGVHGKGGGYRLVKAPSEYKIGDILKVAEGSLAPVACLDCESPACAKTADCRTFPMWKKLGDMIGDYLDGITIADLMKQG